MTTEAAATTGEKRKIQDTDTQSVPATKKAALETPAAPVSEETLKARFSSNLFEEPTRELLKQQITDSEPYKHGVIPELMNDELLRRVRDEIKASLHFTKKETDIYKLFQTGDLRNLSGLDAEEKAQLTALGQLREALYSKPFREHLAYVTGSGALSGTKQDLSINVYQQGCHLLNHDDVIGSRRISYILYLPDPDEVWEYPKNGGALRLYPTEKPNVPAKDWTKVVPPAWNQLAFFTVQPGLSFHDVEEVFVNKPRMSISGWFHIPQRGEEGFIEGELEATEAKSSLHQLESNELQEFDYPKRVFVNVDEQEVEQGRSQIAALEDSEEKTSELLLPLESQEYLAKYLNPTLLKSGPLLQLSSRFLSESVVEVHDFLNAEYASALKIAIDRVDMDDEEAGIKVPFRSTDIELPWKLAGPPHKARYMYLDGLRTYEAEAAAETEAESSSGLSGDASVIVDNKVIIEAKAAKSLESIATSKLLEVRELFQSPHLRAWLRAVSRLNPMTARVLVRRFRPGLDFTLATGLYKKTKKNEDDSKDDSENSEDNDDEPGQLLEATLGLTPSKGWDDGELGGYELYMGVEEEDTDTQLDPAVYRRKDTRVSADGGDSYGKSGAVGKEEGGDEDDDDDDSVLLTTQAGWNVLTLVVRDEGILKFVKYVSGNAPGSRWDVSSEWTIENVDDDDDEDEDKDKDKDKDENEEQD
ncbi:uncharacterized protein SAPINGB_P005869 [Magnusiomyces paraingens]|uniref:uS12 prolyl 3,4-dihydroxylase n=1 Tax=Magnusiomyces paraingens TaxID=2606893 RepID=A0A5E8C276_9ASCO|nr:uncharacterized protein SAPINGB_P005869 [Saprochaete ingens]VVT57787.1 unnamed protein product [Saprochaete ingens]